MRQVLIVGGVMLLAAVNFMLYCCMVVASKEDRFMEKYVERCEAERKNCNEKGF